MDWTDDTIARLRGLWAEGHSTAEIGRRLGVTKNAVVGKAHRLDLPARPSPIRRDGVSGAQPRRPAPRRVAGPTLPPLTSTAPPQLAAASRPAAIAGATAPAVLSPMVGVQPEASRPPLFRPEPFQPQSSRPEPIAVEMARPMPPAVPAPRLQAAPRPYARSVTCCWPIGEPGTKSFRFCDDGATPGKPYCAQHAAVAYVKVRDRREDAA